MERHGRFGASDEENGGAGKQPAESQSWRPRFGVSFTLTMPESSRHRPRSCRGVIVVVCAAFGLTVSEAKTDVSTREGDVGVQRHIQRRGSWPGVH